MVIRRYQEFTAMTVSDGHWLLTMFDNVVIGVLEMMKRLTSIIESLSRKVSDRVLRRLSSEQYLAVNVIAVCIVVAGLVRWSGTKESALHSGVTGTISCHSITREITTTLISWLRVMFVITGSQARCLAA